MRIPTATNKPPGAELPQSVEERRGTAPQQVAFHKQMTDIAAQDRQVRIKQLVEDINAQGETLKKRADIKELHRYRKMITELMNETVSGAYEYSKSSSFDARGRHRVFAIIKKVNSHLDELAAEVLKEQKDNLTILDRVDDIRGLLIDLYM